jgi:NAD(P)-dependent dehydrogenase (short-subunit alcohol dehydrogenase family)
VNVLDSFRLDDTVVVVTGAGRGLGAAAAVALAAAGAHVVLSGRSSARLQDVAEKIRATGASAEVAIIDVTSEESVTAGFSAIAERHGGIDVLINNAAVLHAASAIDTELTDFEHVLRTNLTGSFVCARTFARLAPRRSDRVIVNVSSIVAEGVASGQVAYGASKAGVVSLTRTLAFELARHQIRVNALCPGYFATDLPTAVLADPARRERVLRQIPLRRAAEPAEVGPPIVFLASPASGYMTGASLYFDGGYTA